MCESGSSVINLYVQCDLFQSPKDGVLLFERREMSLPAMLVPRINEACVDLVAPRHAMRRSIEEEKIRLDDVEVIPAGIVTGRDQVLEHIISMPTRRGSPHAWRKYDTNRVDGVPISI